LGRVFVPFFFSYITVHVIDTSHISHSKCWRSVQFGVDINYVHFLNCDIVCYTRDDELFFIVVSNLHQNLPTSNNERCQPTPLLLVDSEVSSAAHFCTVHLFACVWLF
jgi:hypothetical protein